MKHTLNNHELNCHAEFWTHKINIFNPWSEIGEKWRQKIDKIIKMLSSLPNNYEYDFESSGDWSDAWRDMWHAETGRSLLITTNPDSVILHNYEWVYHDTMRVLGKYHRDLLEYDKNYRKKELDSMATSSNLGAS